MTGSLALGSLGLTILVTPLGASPSRVATSQPSLHSYVVMHTGQRRKGAGSVLWLGNM